MKATAELYYGNHRLMDYRVLSTLGFTDEDVQVLAQQGGVGQVMAGWGADALVERTDGVAVARILSLPKDVEAQNPAYLNQLVLTAGCLPPPGNVWQTVRWVTSLVM